MRKVLVLITAILVAAVVVSCSSGTATKPGSTGAAKKDATKVTPPAASGSAAIDISNFAFSPETATIKKGTKVVWTNNDDATHQVEADDSSFSGPSLAKGDTYSNTFDKSGTFPYHCTVHPNMTAKIIVK